MSEITTKPPQVKSVFWTIARALIILWLVVMVAQTMQRVLFPWDVFVWPESPFLTDLLKLDHGLPVYGPPADANSFVYAPGLEYLCYGILNPFGLELDIRCCRIVNLGIGLLAAVCAAWLVTRIGGAAKESGKGHDRFFAGLGVALLVLSTNFMWDQCHPDNLHAFHALSVFCLCLAAVETKRFSLGLATMIWAGWGVFTKQTEVLSVIGPVIVFAHFDLWGWRRWLAACGAGAASAALAVFLLWKPHYGRFYTYELVSHQPLLLGKFSSLITDLNSRERGLMLYLSVVASVYLWGAGAKSRRYMICWLSLGLFSVLPNILAYTKVNGSFNNLSIFEVWLLLIVWPFFYQILDKLEERKAEPAAAGPLIWGVPAITAGLCLAVLGFLVLLKPMKVAPTAWHRQYCENIESAVRKDLLAGLKVLVPHGAEYLIRAGSTNVPLDRSNSILELESAGMASLAGTEARIKSRYYDRIYLVTGEWYGERTLQQIKQNYLVASVISRTAQIANDIYGVLPHGVQPYLTGDCQVLMPREGADAGLPR